MITDGALDPYTSHGQDGVIDEHGYALNDITTEILVKQALVSCRGRVDMVAPSDMMDGRIGALRQALEAHGHIHTSHFQLRRQIRFGVLRPVPRCGGFGGQSGQGGQKTYQMDPANSDEALHEVAMDLAEGADLVMVKPGLPYLDVIRRVKDQFGVPTFAYQVSGRVRHAQGRRAKWLAGRARLHAGKPAGVQARRGGWRR